VQDDGDCGLKTNTFQIVSQFANKKESDVGPKGMAREIRELQAELKRL
jgi:hypothetical protein